MSFVHGNIVYLNSALPSHAAIPAIPEPTRLRSQHTPLIQSDDDHGAPTKTPSVILLSVSRQSSTSRCSAAR